MTHPPEPNPWLATRTTSGVDYDRHFEERAARGEHVHGEADFVHALGARSVLDAGCGTGRVGIELARRGLQVVGVDLDPQMLARAQEKAPHLEWHCSDLATLELGRTFDLVVAAGNVMIFLTPGTERAVLERLARHLVAGGLLVTGFSLRSDGLSLNRYDELAAQAGLQLVSRFATWNREPWKDGGGYAVSAHQRSGEQPSL